MLTRDFDISTFLDHLVYRWLKRYFQSLLFCTQDTAFLRQAVVSGLAMPVTAITRTSPPDIESERYGRSVIKRTTLYNGEPVQFQFVDFLLKYNFFTASYLLQEVNKEYQVVIGLDMDRYFDFDLSDLIPPKFVTRVEFRKTSQELRQEVSDDTDHRRFYISVDWELRVTVPLLESAAYIERVNLFLNNSPIATIGG